MAHDADSANSDRKVNTVTFSAANRLKLANMMMSQNARMAIKGAGMALSDSTNSNRRVWAKSVLTCAAQPARALQVVLWRQGLNSDIDAFRLGVHGKRRSRRCRLFVPKPIGGGGGFGASGPIALRISTRIASASGPYCSAKRRAG